MNTAARVIVLPVTNRQPTPPPSTSDWLASGSDRLLRPKAAMAMLGVSKRTLYRLTDLPPKVRLSARVVGWRESDLLAYMAARAVTPQPQLR